MHCSMDDETSMSTLNVGSSHSQEYWSQEYETEQHGDGVDMKNDGEGEGFGDALKGRAANYHGVRHFSMQHMVQCGHGFDHKHGANKRHLLG